MKNILISMLIFGQVLTVHSLAYGKSRPDMAIVSLKPNLDVETLVKDLSESLKAKGINVVSPENVNSVLGYHDRGKLSVFSKNIQGLLAESKKQYYQFNYIEAKSIVRKVIRGIEKDKDHIFENGSYLLDAYLTLGIISKSMGNIGEARQAFTQALRLNPDYKLDSRAFPPSTMNEFEKSRELVSILPRGSLKIYSRPKVADVYLNGIKKGVTPLNVEDLPEGPYYVEISANKYSVSRKYVYVKARKTAQVRERLAWLGDNEHKPKREMLTSNGQLDEALKIADILRVDKVALIDADPKKNSKRRLSAIVVDSKYRTGFKPISMSYDDLGLKNGRVAKELSQKIVSQMHVNIANNPLKYAYPVGSGDVALLGSKKRSRISKPILFGALGGILAAGLGVGLAVAFSGGGGSSVPSTGNINVSFR